MKRLLIVLCSVVVLAVPSFQIFSLDAHAASVEGSFSMGDGGIDPDDPGFHGDLGDDPDPFGETSVSSSEPEHSQLDPEPDHSVLESEQSDIELHQSFNSMKSDIFIYISIVLPIALLIFGAFFGLKYVIKFFKSTSN